MTKWNCYTGCTVQQYGKGTRVYTWWWHTGLWECLSLKGLSASHQHEERNKAERPHTDQAGNKD